MPLTVILIRICITTSDIRLADKKDILQDLAA